MPSHNLSNFHHEATLRSRGKRETEVERGRDPPYRRKTDQHFNDASMTDDESCPLGCKSKHLLASCPVYQGSNLKQRWEIVRQNRRCRKCLRVSNHTNDCKKADGTSCDKCKKNHHRSLHSEKNNKPQNRKNVRKHDELYIDRGNSSYR